MNLEITYSSDRKEIESALTKLRNLGSMNHGGINLTGEDKKVKDARSDLILSLGQTLLGEAWDCAVKT